ncbi:MAG: hypothetical protein ACJAS1_001648 [Oleiphilaceae bacterium]|jgi:hypothetical protein
MTTDTKNKVMKYQLGDDIVNNALNLMGSFRSIDSNTIKVRTVRGLQEWSTDDCVKFVAPDEFSDEEENTPVSAMQGKDQSLTPQDQPVDFSQLDINNAKTVPADKQEKSATHKR